MTTVTKYQAEEWHLPWKASPTLWGCVWGWRTQHPFHTLRKKSWLWSLTETLSLLNPKNPESEFSFPGQVPSRLDPAHSSESLPPGFLARPTKRSARVGPLLMAYPQNPQKTLTTSANPKRESRRQREKKNRAWKFPPHWASHGPWALAPRVPTKCNG